MEAPDVLTFIARVIGSIAWPTTVLVCVILIRRHLLSLIPLLRSVKYSDVEISFGQEVAQLAKSVDASELPRQPEQHEHWEEVFRVASARPRTAIRIAFKRVEQALAEAARSNGIEVPEAARMMPMVIGAYLLRDGLISPEQYDLLSRIRVLVDEAERAEPDTITSESAAEFISLAIRFAALLTSRIPETTSNQPSRPGDSVIP